MTVLLVWAIGASTLTWEHRKTTWLFLTFIVAAAAADVGRLRRSYLIDISDAALAETSESGPTARTEGVVV
jgi:hypothetical protein